MNTTISPENKLQSILDFEVCKQIVVTAQKELLESGDTSINAILCPHYSINIASKYEDGEALQWDLDELSDYIGHYISVNDYDDLVVELFSDTDDE